MRVVLMDLACARRYEIREGKRTEGEIAMLLRHLGMVGVLALVAACGQAPGVSVAPNTTTAANNASGATTFSKPPPNGSAPASASAPASGPQVGNPVTDRAQFEQLVRNYLDGVERSNAQGMTRAAGFSDEIQPLQANGDYRWAINLNAGTNYRIIGACDNECSNVDIELLDPSGQVVESDVLPEIFRS